MNSQDRSALLRLRLVYFLGFAALGALQPYFSLLFADRGLRPGQMALLFALIPLGGLISPPILATLADKSGDRTKMLAIVLLGCGLATLLFLPAWGLTGLLVAMGVFSLASRALAPLADSATYSVLGDNQADFGRTRVWGSVGFAMVALGVGYFHGTSATTWRLEVGALLYVLSCIVALLVRVPTGPKASGRVASLALQEVRRGPCVIFLVATALYFGAHSTHDAFFSLHVRHLGLSDQIVGGAWALGVGVEVVIMMFTPSLLRLQGPSRWLLLCASVATIRWALLSVVTSAAAVVAVQALHGVTFGLWYLASVAWMQKRAPPHLRASMQAAMSMAMAGGAVLSLLLNGVFIDAWGIQRFYGVAALIALLAGVSYVVVLARERAEGGQVSASGLG